MWTVWLIHRVRHCSVHMGLYISLSSWLIQTGFNLNLIQLKVAIWLGDKYYIDVEEDEHNSALGTVIAYIADIYIKLHQTKQTAPFEFPLTDLLEWVSDERVTLLYNCHQIPDTKLGFAFALSAYLLTMFARLRENSATKTMPSNQSIYRKRRPKRFFLKRTVSTNRDLLLPLIQNKNRHICRDGEGKGKKEINARAKSAERAAPTRSTPLERIGCTGWMCTGLSSRVVCLHSTRERDVVHQYQGSRTRDLLSDRVGTLLLVLQADCSRFVTYFLLWFFTHWIPAKSLGDAIHQFVHDNKTEFPNEVNILERFNIYQEIFLGIIYRVFRPSQVPILWYAYSGSDFFNFQVVPILSSVQPPIPLLHLPVRHRLAADWLVGAGPAQPIILFVTWHGHDPHQFHHSSAREFCPSVLGGAKRNFDLVLFTRREKQLSLHGRTRARLVSIRRLLAVQSICLFTPRFKLIT